MASVEALAQLQVPMARVRRSGSVEQVDSSGLVPGDVVLIEAGELVPADARIVTAASLEVQEASLTGESAPIAKDATTLPDGETALGDRTNLVFQNTQVTRGSAVVVVVATGAATQMGHIADMVTATKRTKSPLQRELDGLTKLFGILAWAAVAVIAIFGIARGQDSRDARPVVHLDGDLGHPDGPADVRAADVVVRGAAARRGQSGRQVAHRRRDARRHDGDQQRQDRHADDERHDGDDDVDRRRLVQDRRWRLQEVGRHPRHGGRPTPDFTRLALGLVLCSDATVADDESIIGDPTEAALVVLAAKIGVDAEESRRTMPRTAAVPFDSEYKFMATFHDRPDWIAGGVLSEPHVVCVKGAPDVIIERCATALWHGQQVPIEQVRDELLDANRQLSERGLRVLGFALRDLPSDAMTAALADPMGEMHDLILISLVGIIDPLRAEAVDAVRVAHAAGIDVRMITGDHTVTARAIADELGLGPGVITGTDLSHLSDEEVIAQLPQLHVFGRVAPEDKVRLARLMQESGEVVAMTGDAVNDAAALKQADVGVAMGSGSEVTKQAGKLVLTDDNFATLVKAVEYGRDIYRRISSYVKLQLTILSSVLQLMLFATILNINEGVALFPMQLLFAKFFVVVTVVIGFIVDVPDPGVMQRPPRTPGSRIATRAQTVRWAITGFIIASLALMVLSWGPDEPSTENPSVSMTMAFAVVALSAVNNGLVMRREREAWWSSPIFPYLGWIFLGWILTWAAVELNMLQRLLDTVPLTGDQWVVVIALSLVAPAFTAIDKAIHLRRLEPCTARPLIAARQAG